MTRSVPALCEALWQSNSRVQRCLSRYWPFAPLIKRWAYDDFFLVRGEISSVAIVDVRVAMNRL